MVVKASARTVACVGVRTLGVAAVTTGIAGRNESVICASAAAVASILYDALGPRITAREAGSLVVVQTGARPVAGVRIRTFCIAAVTAGATGRNESVICAGAAAVASILYDALGPRIAAGETGSLVVVQAGARTVTSIRIGTLGVATVTASTAG